MNSYISHSREAEEERPTVTVQNPPAATARDRLAQEVQIMDLQRKELAGRIAKALLSAKGQETDMAYDIIALVEQDVARRLCSSKAKQAAYESDFVRFDEDGNERYYMGQALAAAAAAIGLTDHGVTEA